jgi:rubrerythrin
MMKREKIPVLIRHWIEHNESHGEEYRRWADIAREEGLERVESLILEAADRIRSANEKLKEALEDL